MDDLGIRVAFVTSERLYDEQRQQISQTFGCPVANGYGGHGPGHFSDGLVNSALRYRAQAPLVDQLLREIGIEGGDIQRLVGGVSGAQVALPPGPPASKKE